METCVWPVAVDLAAQILWNGKEFFKEQWSGWSNNIQPSGFRYGIGHVHVGPIFYQILRSSCPCKSSCPRDRRGPWTFGRGATEPWRFQDEVSPFTFSPTKFGTQKADIHACSAAWKEQQSIPDGRAEVASEFVCPLPQRRLRGRRWQGALLLLLPPMCRSKTDWKGRIQTQCPFISTFFSSFRKFHWSKWKANVVRIKIDNNLFESRPKWAALVCWGFVTTSHQFWACLLLKQIFRVR